MRKSFTVLIVICALVVLTTSSLAIYYRDQAAYFQREYNLALDRLSRMPPVSLAHVSAALPPGQTAEKKPAVARVMDSLSSQRRDTEFPGAEQGNPLSIPGVALPPRNPESERARRRSSDWIENLRTNDPQRYAEFQQRRQSMQENIQNAWTQASDYFMNRDTSRMNPADQEEYKMMIALLGQASSLSQQLQSGLPADVRQQVATDLRSNVVAVMPLLENERNREYYDVAVAMGHNEQDAATMVDYINQIASNTSLRTIIPGARIGGMPGGNPPGR